MLEFLLGFEHIHHYKEIKKMGDKNDTSIARSGERAPKRQPRPEESQDWVIEIWRRRQLAIVSAELDEQLGEGRHPENYIDPVLLDINPVQYRQSLLEKIFPSPRVIREDLRDVAPNKVMLEADSGMGKTTFLKIYQERLLEDTDPGEYPLPVYFDLGRFPEGARFSRFFELFYKDIIEVIKMEEEDQPGLKIDEIILGKTIQSLVFDGRVLFMLDHLDLLQPEDRFQVYYEVIVEGEALQDNFVIFATRPLNFGPLASSSVLRRGKNSCFRTIMEKISEEVRKPFLGSAALKNEIGRICSFSPELLETPILLKMIRTLYQNELLDEIKTRADIYSAFITFKLEEGNPEGGREWVDQVFDRLSQVAFRLFNEGRYHRYEYIETGFDKKSFQDDSVSENPLLENNQIIPALEFLLQQTETRWEFRHPSFQEFFAARGLAKQPDWEKVVRKRCRDEKWEEILRFFTHFVSITSDELYDLYLEEGALFLAGNSLSEVSSLSESRRLLVGQFLKYQCKEKYPQFSRNRLIKLNSILEKVDRDYLKKLIGQLLSREKRDSRILFGVIELLLAMNGIDFLEMIDEQNFEPLRETPELKEFMEERADPEKVDVATVKKWSEMVTVPAGKFIYQDEKDKEDQIDLKEYSIMKYPVTNALYKEYDPNFQFRFQLYSRKDHQPAIGINYYQATIFTIWLGLRLPFEKEWEKAARGTDGREYPWGDVMGYQSGYANTCDFMLGQTNPVTDFENGISPYGCFDMAGNVWEWCAQLHSSQFTTQKLVRGGSWLTYLVNAKATYRNSFDPTEQHMTVGFRCSSIPHTEIEDDEDEEL